MKAKMNLAPDKAALSYTVTTRCVGRDDELGEDIWAPYIVFGDEHVEVTANEAMQAAAAGAPKSPAKKDAIEFLRKRLADGPVPQEEIIDEAVNGEGFSKRTLERAKRELGVVSEKEKGKPDGKWCWKLEDPDVMTV